MRKILIISYFYPPCNLTAAQRVQGWAKYLHESGYYPIIITRNWDKPIQRPEDVLRSSGNETKIEQNDTHEVHYLPYRAGIRDRVFTRLSGTKFQWISKFFTLFELIMENFSFRFIPHKNLYTYSDKLLAEDKSIKTVLISGNPFNQFAFGYQLKKKYSIQWIADYRDDWNTSELTDKPHGSSSFIGRLQCKSEKKWVGSAAMITSVSDYYVKKIAAFVERPGEVILNGYDFELPTSLPTTESNVFRITYNGSLYSSQPIEVFLEAMKTIIRCNAKNISIEIHFPGLAFDSTQKARVEELSKEIKEHVFITSRLPKEEVIDLQLKSDVLLMVAHTNIKGIPSSKLFEYIGLNRPILVVPNDHDVIESFVTETQSGFIANTSEECVNILTELIHKKRMGENRLKNSDTNIREKYSRRNQAKVLGELLDNIAK